MQCHNVWLSMISLHVVHMQNAELLIYRLITFLWELCRLQRSVTVLQNMPTQSGQSCPTFHSQRAVFHHGQASYQSLNGRLNSCLNSPPVTMLPLVLHRIAIVFRPIALVGRTHKIFQAAKYCHAINVLYIHSSSLASVSQFLQFCSCFTEYSFFY